MDPDLSDLNLRKTSCYIGFMKGIFILRRQKFDTTLRDGAKSLGLNLNINEKMEISRQLVKLGADVIEAVAGLFSATWTWGHLQEIRGAVICGFFGADERK